LFHLVSDACTAMFFPHRIHLLALLGFVLSPLGVHAALPSGTQTVLETNGFADLGATLTGPSPENHFVFSGSQELNLAAAGNGQGAYVNTTATTQQTLTVAANGTTVSTFQLTAIAFDEFMDTDRFNITVIGTKPDNSTISSPAVSGTTGVDTYPVNLSSFAGVQLKSFTIQFDAPGTRADDLSLVSFTVANAQAPDATPPTVTGVTSSTANGSYNLGDVVSVQVVFTESVTVTGTPQLTLETGATDRIVNYASGSGSSTLTFTYTVQAGDTSADLDYVSTSALALNSGTIRDAALNNATLTLPSPGAAGSLGANKALVIDTTAPSVSIGAPSVALTRTGPVTYTVTYADTNSPVSTLSTGNITLNTTGNANATVGVSGSGTTRTVTLSSITGDGTLGISIAAGTASDSAGNTAPAAGPSTTFTVDNTAPVITSLATAGGTFNASFNYTITASGSPVSFGASGLPSGLSINTTNGQITGLPSQTGGFSVTISATDSAGNTGSTTLNLTIAKATATVTLNPASLSPTYNGSPRAVTATTVPSGLTVNFTYDGSGTAPTNAGSYAVIGTVSDANYQGSASGTLVIAKATATVTLNPASLSPIYNGSPRAVTATTTPSGLTVNLTYDGSGTAPTNAGSYAVIGTVSDTNYQGSASGTLAVAKAALTVTADAKTRAYGFANPTLTATLTGFVGGDTLGTAVSGAPGLSTTATLGSTPGTYPITTALGTLSAVNYTFSLVDGVLTVRLQEIADWQEDNFTPTELLDPDISGPDADPDLDGVTNLREYAFGTDPNDIASGPDGLLYTGSVLGGGTLDENGQPISRLESTVSGRVSRVLFIRRRASFTEELDYTVQFTSDNAIWATSTNTPDVLATDGLWEVVAVPYQSITNGKKTRAFRVVPDLLP
jgi:hypothetical protein